MGRIGLVIGMIWLGCAAPAWSQVRGEPAAVAAAEALLAQVGGREAWSRRTFYVEERGYLANGEIAEIRVWRDFREGVRRLENATPTRKIVEWTAPGNGWVSRNGERRAMTPPELAGEVIGLRQEPYAIYHRLARRDPALRFELRDNGGRLMALDADERVLCWFLLDRKGGLVGWGNHWQGDLNQHSYGPLTDMGDVNLPRWGANTTGSFRFEYLRARMSDDPPPPQAQP